MPPRAVHPIRSRNPRERRRCMSLSPPRHRVIERCAPKPTTSPPTIVVTTPAPMGSAALAGRPMGGASPFSASNSAAQLFTIGGGINATASFRRGWCACHRHVHPDLVTSRELFPDERSSAADAQALKSARTPAIMLKDQRRLLGGIGRRDGFKIHYSQGCIGSTPIGAIARESGVFPGVFDVFFLVACPAFLCGRERPAQYRVCNAERKVIDINATGPAIV